jgi:CheY-like chemotaxis protein
MRSRGSGQRTILIVDDDAAVTTQLADLFQIEGYDVTVASDGLEALQAFEAGLVPDVMILDLHMEGVSGWDVNAELAGMGIEVPIVVVSADPERELRAAQLGAVASLPKPLDFRELLRVVDRAVRMKRSERKSA